MNSLNLEPKGGGLSQSVVSDAELGALRQSVSNLRILLQLTVIALVIVVGSVNVFLFHQVSLLRRQAVEMQLASMEMKKAVDEYETNTLPLMERFLADLRKFAERDPAFAQILAKYPLPAPKTTNTVTSTNLPPQPAVPEPSKTQPTKSATPQRGGTRR